MVDARLASPPVNVIKDCFAWYTRVLLVYILCHLLNKVVLAHPFDELV
jgi:hypothetical protein